jgi:UDP-N-acetylglucosamine acyltransferase
MVEIHPSAIVEPSVQLGMNVHVGAFTVIKGRVAIGDNTFISSHVSIGEEAEHSVEKWELHPRHYNGRIHIGTNVVLREFVTVHQPVKDVTHIGDDAYIMGRSHIGHDMYIEDQAVISNGTVLGGYTRVMRGANLGICCCTHQFTTIGAYAMIAANATVVKDVPPLATYIPQKELTLNIYAIRKFGLPLIGQTLADVAISPFYQKLLDEWRTRRHPERSIYGQERPYGYRFQTSRGPVSRH